MIKKTTIAKILVGALILASTQWGGVSKVLATSSTQLREQAAAMGNKINEANEKLQQQQENADALTEEANTLTGKVKKLSGQLSSVVADIEVAENNIQDVTAMIEDTTERLEEATATSERQYEAMKSRIKYMYENGNMSMLTQMLQSTSFASMLKKAEYISAITSYDRDMYSDYLDTQASIAQTKEELEQQQAKLYEEQDNLDKKRVELKGLVSGAKSDLDDKQQEVANAKEEMAALQKEIEKMKAEEARLEAAAVEAALEEARRQAEKGYNETYGRPYDYDDNDLKVLANIIYCEAGGETYDAQVGVGSAIMNRVESSLYPNDITEVVVQNNGKVWQFSPVQSGRFATALSKDSATQSCYKAAKEVLSGVRNTQFLNFMTVSLAQTKGLDQREDISYTIYCHCFFWGYNSKH